MKKLTTRKCNDCGDEFECEISYHPEHGMIVLDRKYK